MLLFCCRQRLSRRNSSWLQTKHLCRISVFLKDIFMFQLDLFPKNCHLNRIWSLMSYKSLVDRCKEEWVGSFFFTRGGQSGPVYNFKGGCSSVDVLMLQNSKAGADVAKIGRDCRCICTRRCSLKKILMYIYWRSNVWSVGVSFQKCMMWLLLFVDCQLAACH